MPQKRNDVAVLNGCSQVREQSVVFLSLAVVYGTALGAGAYLARRKHEDAVAGLLAGRWRSGFVFSSF